jgi:hypothetical protein
VGPETVVAKVAGHHVGFPGVVGTVVATEVAAAAGGAVSEAVASIGRVVAEELVCSARRVSVAWEEALAVGLISNASILPAVEGLAEAWAGRAHCIAVAVASIAPAVPWRRHHAIQPGSRREWISRWLSGAVKFVGHCAQSACKLTSQYLAHWARYG